MQGVRPHHGMEEWIDCNARDRIELQEEHLSWGLAQICRRGRSRPHAPCPQPLCRPSHGVEIRSPCPAHGPIAARSTPRRRARCVQSLSAASTSFPGASPAGTWVWSALRMEQQAEQRPGATRGAVEVRSWSPFPASREDARGPFPGRGLLCPRDSRATRRPRPPPPPSDGRCGPRASPSPP